MDGGRGSYSSPASQYPTYVLCRNYQILPCRTKVADDEFLINSRPRRLKQLDLNCHQVGGQNQQRLPQTLDKGPQRCQQRNLGEDGGRKTREGRCSIWHSVRTPWLPHFPNIPHHASHLFFDVITTRKAMGNTQLTDRCSWTQVAGFVGTRHGDRKLSFHNLSSFLN